MRLDQLERYRDSPAVFLAGSKRLQLKSLLDYYDSKIECLKNPSLPPKLVLMACWDAPVKRPLNITNMRAIKRFKKRCIRYYEKQRKLVLKALKKAEKSF